MIFKPKFERFIELPLNSMAIVFLVTASLALVFSLSLPGKFSANESSDYISFYKPVALNLLEGNGLRDINGTPAVRYPPGFPLILAGLFKLAIVLNISKEILLKLFTSFCIGLSSLFIFLLAKNLWGPKYALISVAGFVTYPFVLWLSKQPNSELPFMVALYGSLLVFILAYKQNIAWYLYFFSGVLVGISMLIRPIAILLPLVLSFVLWFLKNDVTNRHCLLPIILIFAGSILAIAPWEAWIYYQKGKILLLSSGGVSSIKDGLTFGIAVKGFRQQIWVPGDVKALMVHFQLIGKDLKTIDSIIWSIIAQLREQPLALIKLIIFKATRCWFGTDSHRYERAIFLIQLPYLALFIWSTKFSLKSEQGKDFALLAWMILLYFWMMTIFVIPILRYMVPALGLLFILLPAIFFAHNYLPSKN
jgi:4-amino-4-deoxy-L-arabinose transferase-like glycosyltransferase